MNGTRGLILMAGPVALVGLSYRLAMGPSAGAVEAVRPPSLPAVFPVEPPRPTVSRELRRACEATAAEVRRLFGEGASVLVRPPYILAGDFGEAELDRMHQSIIVPTAQALATCYFDQAPDEPVTILMFATEAAFREHARRLDRRNVRSEYGYYRRNARRVVVNLDTGPGTLRHELTHALAHFDFPAMPEWFDEGLAALHEESELTADGLRIEGRPNGRAALLRQAAASGRLPSVESLLARRTVRPDHADVDYAHARGLCLYLQQRGLLAHFYRKFRHGAATDPTGRHALCEILHTESLAPLDRAFRAWALQ